MATVAQGREADVLLVLMPWELPTAFIEETKAANPGLEVIAHVCGRHDTGIPSEIPTETWSRATVLFTWKAIPPKELMPKLEYIQLLSAGCNHVADSAFFKETDVSFCTANGVHP